MADQPDRSAGEPQPQAEADRGGERAVDDRDRARRAAQQDRLGERAMDRRLEAWRWARAAPSDQRSAAEAEKKDRKKLDAAKAIDRPKTIWIRRRKPPEVSPKASVRPVMMMMMTRDDLRDRSLDGFQDLIAEAVSHGMLEPAAYAGAVVRAKPKRRWRSR